MPVDNLAGGSQSPEPASGSSSKAGTTSAFTTATAPAPSQAMRRSFTFDDARRRPSPFRPSSASEIPFEAPRRRSSNFTDYSLSEARDILNPRVQDSGELPTPETSSLASASLAFALLPALAGALFKNGSALVTDLMLLGLAGVFLHWSVTQPWTWYRSAQEVRIQQEATFDYAVEEDEESDTDVDEAATKDRGSLDDVPEDEEDEAPTPSPEDRDRSSKATNRQRSALQELYKHEVLSLLACFVLPLVSAFLLHAIRAQLSRPSEGLVSNYNLTIFILVSELRVFSHIFKLLQSRTLHLQRLVHGNPFGSQNATRKRDLDGILERLSKLEGRSEDERNVSRKDNETDSTGKPNQQTAIFREVRESIQPELDALNRAVRRYEKKATLLQFQTETHFSVLDTRLDDAIALAAAAAKSKASRKNILVWVFEAIVGILLVPINAILLILLFPLRALLRLTGQRSGKASSSSKPSRAPRSGKAPAQSRYSGDRVPGRLTKR